MAVITTNVIGGAGENLTALRLEKDGYFKVYFLGEKAPIEDFLLEILDETHPYHCLLQVKSTGKNNRYQVCGNINTPVPDDKLEKLINRPLPTYVVGADIEEEVVFIAPANDKKRRYPSIPTGFRLDNKDKDQRIANLEKLRDEIIRYWEESGILDYKYNRFKSALGV